MKIEIFYVYPIVKPEIYDRLHQDFFDSMHRHNKQFVFSVLRPDAGSGKDIGAYIQAAKTCDADIMVCLGSHVRINQDGWLKRIFKVWEKHGPGLYGPFATNEPIPHLRTTAFWCSPTFLKSYPWEVVTDQDRYNFELSPVRSITTYAQEMKLPVKQVLLDGEFSYVFNPAPRTQQLLMLDRFTDMQEAAAK